MHISYRQLFAFVQVAQSSTFAEAAEKMHVSQPALSLSIKKMEHHLGGTLISRSTRKVQLSPEGKEFLPVALRLLHDWDNAVEDITNVFAMRRGKLNIAAMPSFASSILPTILSAFHQQWENVNINVLDVVMESVIELVREGRAELGFTFENETLDGLDFYPMFSDKFIAVVPQTSPLSRFTQLDVEALCEYKFVAMNRGSSVRRWIDEYMEEQGLMLDIVVEAGQLTTLGQCVKNELGVSVIPGICQQQMESKGLTCIPIIDDKLRKRVGMIKKSRSNLSVPAKALWEKVQSYKGFELTNQ